MRLLVITPELSCQKEAEAIDRLFREGLELLHVRKPGYSLVEMDKFLSGIDSQWYERLVLHDHFELAARFGINRLHLNNRNSQHPEGSFLLSRSCHRWDEAKEALTYCGYAFLSPVFNSISKQGYHASFRAEDFESTLSQGIDLERLIALGGIQPSTIPLAKNYGFGGVAVLGSLWNTYLQNQDTEALIHHFTHLKHCCQST